MFFPWKHDIMESVMSFQQLDDHGSSQQTELLWLFLGEIEEWPFPCFGFRVVLLVDWLLSSVFKAECKLLFSHRDGGEKCIYTFPALVQSEQSQQEFEFGKLILFSIPITITPAVVLMAL